MNKDEIKSLLGEIDTLLSNAEKKKEAPSKEVVDLLEEISNDLVAIKERKKEELDRSVADKLDRLISVASEGGNISSETSKSIVSAIEKIKLVVPAPQVKVEPPKVEVNVPPVQVPEVKIPPINVPAPVVQTPDEVKIKKPSWFPSFPSLKPVIEGITQVKNAILNFSLPRDAKNAIAVRLSDGEKFYRALGGALATVANAFPFAKSTGETKTALVDDDGHQQVDVLTMPDITVNASDIQIGAVEIKNSTDDTRATVDAYGLATKATIAETAPTDATKVNPSTAYSYDGDGNLQYKDKTIGATTYRKTYTYTGGVLTAQSAYVAT